MKENVIDVLMYLFEHYYLDEDGDTVTDRDVVQEELSQAGFPSRQIERAFSWMEDLTSEADREDIPAGQSIRLYSASELRRFDTECRGFLTWLEQIGVLTPASRERAIELAMALESDDMDLDQMKWVVMMVLYNQPDTTHTGNWLENLVFDDSPGALH